MHGMQEVRAGRPSPGHEYLSKGERNFYLVFGFVVAVVVRGGDILLPPPLPHPPTPVFVFCEVFTSPCYPVERVRRGDVGVSPVITSGRHRAELNTVRSSDGKG